jgi:hypothetical protein
MAPMALDESCEAVERAVVDVLFDDPGRFTLQYVTPGRAYPPSTIWVLDPSVERSRPNEFNTLRVMGPVAPTDASSSLTDAHGHQVRSQSERRALSARDAPRKAREGSV